ncbi:MAG: RNA methyltransferase, partial [Slackia sp.]|nr:RNA methyltransferase [Slackia sp.]
MPYIELESLDDARLDVFARLTEAQLRNKLEPEKGIFIVESEKVIDRALLGGVQPLSMLMTPEWVDRTREIVARAEAACEEPGGMPVFVVPSKEAERLTGFAVTRGILLACRRPQLPSVEDLLARVDAEKAARAAAVAAGELDPGEVGNMHDA